MLFKTPKLNYNPFHYIICSWHSGSWENTQRLVSTAIESKETKKMISGIPSGKPSFAIFVMDFTWWGMWSVDLMSVSSDFAIMSSCVGNFLVYFGRFLFISVICHFYSLPCQIIFSRPVFSPVLIVSLHQPSPFSWIPSCPSCFDFMCVYLSHVFLLLFCQFV